MKEYLNKLPQEMQEIICLAKSTALELGYKAYLVGGFVRDLILGAGNLDLDICVEGDGIDFAEHLAGKLNLNSTIHRRFGTATIHIKPHLKLDIATVRKEFYPERAALPVVSPGTIKDDLARRDFTINAMGIVITGAEFGKLIDFFGGLSDIKNKKIRVLHKLSFIDDPTRMLRAIRFKERYNFAIEKETLKFLKEALKAGMLSVIEPQRLRDEIILILKEKNPLKYIKRIGGLLKFTFISESLNLSQDNYKLLKAIQAEIAWFEKKFIRHRKLDSWLIYFMGMLDNLSLKEIKNICKKFVLRNGDKKRTIASKKLWLGINQKLKNNKIPPSIIFHLLEPLSYEVILLFKAKAGSSAAKKNIVNFFCHYNGVRHSVSGHDLKEMGIAPGPSYKKLFCRILNAKLDGKIKNRSEELAFLAKIAKKK